MVGILLIPFKLQQRKYSFSPKSECKLNFRIAGVVMLNHASVDFEVKAGDRIAQLVCERIAYPEIQVICNYTKTILKFYYLKV